MPRAPEGLVTIAEFGSVIEADHAVSVLLEAGIAASATTDPVMFPYPVANGGASVAVATDEVARARDLLDDAGFDAAALHPDSSLPWKPALVVVGGVVFMLAIIGLGTSYGSRGIMGLVNLVLIGAGIAALWWIRSPATAESDPADPARSAAPRMTIWEGRRWLQVTAVLLILADLLALTATVWLELFFS